MFAVSLAEVRRHGARLLATCLAIVIAVGFVVATLVLNQTSKNTVYASVAAPYRHADAVVLPSQDSGTPLEEHKHLLAEIGHVPGVSDAVADTGGADVQLKLPGSKGFRAAEINNSTSDPRLSWQRMTAGRLPTKDGEVALGQQSGVAVGSSVVLKVYPDNTSTAVLRDAVVTGVVDLDGLANLAGADQLYLTDHQARAWGSTGIAAIRVAAAAGTDPAQLRDRIAGMLSTDHQDGLQVVSGDQAAQQAAAYYTRNAASLAQVLLVFAAVAVLVCALVIANTYAVLLAQRVRELALLRCVGATGRQLLRGVLIESLITGALASAAGVLAGIGLSAAVSAIAAHTNSPIPLSGLAVPASAVVYGMVLGTVVTVLSALAPALRATTRIAPLAALRPMDAPALRTRAGLLRRAAGLLLLVPAAPALVSGATDHNLEHAVLGGAASFVAALLLARWLVPAAVGLAGRTIRNTGVPGKLAALNSVRNPQRTAATATALIIGVTLTTTMVVGAASTRATTEHGLDHKFPTDVVVHDSNTGSPPLPADLPARLAAQPHVAAALGWRSAEVEDASGSGTEVVGLDRATVGQVVRSRSGAGVPAPGTVSAPKDVAELWGADGSEVRLHVGRRSIRLRVHVVGEDTPASMNAADLARLAPHAGIRTIWLRLDDGLSSRQQSDALDAVNNLSAEVAPDSFVEGAAQEHHEFDDLIDTLLLIVTGLLGVAVVIAIIGVGNTLALSVVERRQESGLLRALGLTRNQLRWMLLCEAVLIAGVAAVLGVLLGAAYGALGTTAVLGNQGPVSVVIPVGQVLAIVLVATAAGAIASVLPARRAARTSPVVAIAG